MELIYLVIAAFILGFAIGGFVVWLAVKIALRNANVDGWRLP